MLTVLHRFRAQRHACAARALSIGLALAAAAIAVPAHAAVHLRAGSVVAVGSTPGDPPTSGDVIGTVTDSANGHPLQSAEVTVQRTTNIVANTTTDPFGRFIIHDLSVGDYVIVVHFIGYASQTHPLTITSGTTRIDFHLSTAAAALAEVQVDHAAGVPWRPPRGNATGRSIGRI